MDNQCRSRLRQRWSSCDYPATPGLREAKPITDLEVLDLDRLQITSSFGAVATLGWSYAGTGTRCTEPPLARIGFMNLKLNPCTSLIALLHLPMEGVCRPWTLSEKRGLMKAIIDAQSDCIPGFTAFGT